MGASSDWRGRRSPLRASDGTGDRAATRSSLSVCQTARRRSLPRSPSGPMTKLQDGTFSNLTTDAAGRRYAFNRTIIDVNIWRFEVTDQTLSQLISSSEEDSEPHFSPDGSRILFRSKRTGHFELYV